MNKQFLITDYLSKENINPQNNILETKKIRLEDFNQKSKIFEKKKQIKNKDFVFKNQFLNSDSLSSDSSERGKLNLKKTQSDFSVFESKIINFDLLPNDILLIIMNFLPLKDLILKFQCINKQIREICSDQKIWQYLSNKQNLTIATKYKKIQTICERRSKGKVYKAVSRLSNETVIKNIIFKLYKIRL